MPRSLKIEECLWVRSPNSEHPIFRPITAALQARGAETYSLKMKANAESLPKLKEILWKTDKHVVLHGLLPGELHALKPILAERRNFSMALIDWWTSPWWYTRHAEYLFFNLYNGIAIRNGLTTFGGGWKAPLLSAPEMMIPFHLAGSALRVPALLAAPFREMIQRRRRDTDNRDPKRFLYFPISINTTDVPHWTAAPDDYDFSNTGATYGIWLMRDAYAPARYDFANIYRDRELLIDGILKFENQPYKVFDRRGRARLTWPEYCRVVQRSRFAISTGGVQEASIPKYLEYVCMGTPVLGRPLPYEYPLLRNCIFTVDAMRHSPAELKRQLNEALEVQPKLRENCLAVRERIVRLYDSEAILDLLQMQLDGQPIPTDYVQLNP
jgi:hypothetical protein